MEAPAPAEAAPDPAVAAFRCWIDVAHERHTYRAPDGRNWEDDPNA